MHLGKTILKMVEGGRRRFTHWRSSYFRGLHFLDVLIIGVDEQ
jgi:hypothetical protein